MRKRLYILTAMILTLSLIAPSAAAYAQGMEVVPSEGYEEGNGGDAGTGEQDPEESGNREDPGGDKAELPEQGIIVTKDGIVPVTDGELPEGAGMPAAEETASGDVSANVMIVGWSGDDPSTYTGESITLPIYEAFISEHYNGGKPITVVYENNVNASGTENGFASINCYDEADGHEVFSRGFMVFSRDINETEQHLGDVKKTEIDKFNEAIVLTYNGMTLVEGRDYTIAGYRQVRDALLVTVSADGVVPSDHHNFDENGHPRYNAWNPSNYDGEMEVMLILVPEELTEASESFKTGVTVTSANAADAFSLIYKERELVKGNDYNIKSSAVNGEYVDVVCEGIGDFYRTKTVRVPISKPKKDIGQAGVGISNTGNMTEGVIEPIKWTGSKIEADDHLELYYNGSPVPKDEYSITYPTNCTDIGTHAYYVIAANKNYASMKYISFSIVCRKMDEDVVNVSTEASDAGSASGCLKLRDKTLGNDLVSGTDYEITGANPASAAEMVYTVHGIGHYTGYAQVSVKVKAAQTPDPSPGEIPQTGSSAIIGTAAVSIRDKFSSDTVKFTSSNKKTATVNSKGAVTGRKAGDVTITGYRKVKSGKKYVYEETGTYEAHVVIPKMKKFTVISYSEKRQAFDEMLYDNENIKPDSWESSNKKVATIDPSTGEITVLKTGTTNITAVYGKYRKKAALTVKLPKMNKAKATINAGKTVKLKLSTGTPGWKSSDESVAKVDAYGVVTGTGSGTATITASVGQDEYTSVITVKKPTLNKKSAAIKVNKTVKLKLSAGSASWSSSDSSVASVDSSGTVTGIKPGTATIKAVYGHDEVTCTITVK